MATTRALYAFQMQTLTNFIALSQSKVGTGKHHSRQRTRHAPRWQHTHLIDVAPFANTAAPPILTHECAREGGTPLDLDVRSAGEWVYRLEPDHTGPPSAAGARSAEM